MPRYGPVWLEIAGEQYVGLPAEARKQVDKRVLDGVKRKLGTLVPDGAVGAAGASVAPLPAARQRLATPTTAVSSAAIAVIIPGNVTQNLQKPDPLPEVDTTLILAVVMVPKPP